MKRAVCLVLIFIMLITFCACGEKDYLKSKDGDLVVTLPEKEETDVDIDSRGIYSDSLIVGYWDLIKITDDNKTVTYEDSYYVFDGSGKYKLVVGDESRSGRFDMTDKIITLSNTRLYYSVTTDTLELRTNLGKVHHLVRRKEEPEQ